MIQLIFTILIKYDYRLIEFDSDTSKINKIKMKMKMKKNSQQQNASIERR